MTRQTKTPRQRAEDASAIADRRYKRAVVTRDRLASELKDVEAEVEEATALRTYAKQHPALKNTTTPTNTTGTAGQGGTTT